MESFIKDPIFTKEDFLTIVSLANDGEKIPICALLAAQLNEVSQEDIEWGKTLCKRLNRQ